MLFLRALLAFVMLPGVVAGLGPALIARRLAMHEEFKAAGFTVLGVGLVLLLWCVRDFYVAGKGTLAPWDPPRRLVVVGLYRFVRNPMYVGVATVLAGWALLYRSPGLTVYLVAVCVMFHLRVILYEEPTLLRLFGDEWVRYRERVHRWWPTGTKPDDASKSQFR